MSDYFIENKSFWSLKGVLGRRDFIVNLLVIEIIEAVLYTTPRLFFLFKKPGLVLDMISSGEASVYAKWWLIWLLIVLAIEVVLIFPSCVRRVRDIIGEEDDNRIFMISTILAILLFVVSVGSLLPIWRFVALFILLSLVFKKGKITGEKPANNLIKFNWGAFFGTWLWGIFNKTPITLLMIPLFFTVGAFPFMLICGLKGNEWAYKNNNKEHDNLETFHTQQSKQALLWGVLAPIIVFVTWISLGVSSGVVLYKQAKKNPEIIEKLNNWFKELQQANAETAFSEIDLDGDIYKFYIKPEDMEEVPNAYKDSIFRSAVYYAAEKKGVSITPFRLNTTDEEYQKQFKSFVEVSNKTKIYSTFNNEVLVEYSLDADKYASEILKAKENRNFKEIYRILQQGYKFNNYPTLP